MARTPEERLILMAQSIVDVLSARPADDTGAASEIIYTSGFNPDGSNESDPSIPWASLSAAVRRALTSRYLAIASSPRFALVFLRDRRLHCLRIQRYARLATTLSPLASRAA